MTRDQTRRQRDREMAASVLIAERQAKFETANRSIAAWMHGHPEDSRTALALSHILAGDELPDDLLVELNELALRDFF